MSEQDLEGRMARLEATVEAFVTTVRSQFDNTNEQFEALYKHIDGLRDAIQQRDRTPWGNIFAAGTLLIAVIAMGAQGYIRDLSRLQTLQDRTTASFLDHIRDGHPSSLERTLEHITEEDREVHDWIRQHDNQAIQRYSDVLRGRE